MQTRTHIVPFSLRMLIVVGMLLGGTVSSGGLAAMPSAAARLAPQEDFPPDPTSDIPDSNNIVDLASLQATINNARSVENTQLATTVPPLTLPSQAAWNGMSISERGLWLVNRERLDRGVKALHGTEPNVTAVAQAYAQYLLDNNTWGHTADGKDPWKRLGENATINACRDFLGVAENLSVAVSSGSEIPMPVERAIYGWMYEDADSAWGHRHMILWKTFTENGGPGDKEGFMGIGRASGGPYSGPFGQSWPLAELVVMNVFDPCATWNYGGPPPPPVGDFFLYLSVVKQ